MSVPFRRSVALSLALCLLLMSGLFYAQAVPHTFHHAHHQAATHSTALCSWLCAAGQVFEGTAVVLHSDRNPVGLADPIVGLESGSTVHLTALSRGPPSLSV